MKLINESQRLQKLAGLLNENQDVEEGIGKALGTAALGAALLGSPKQGMTQTRPSMEQSIMQMNNKDLADSVIEAYKKSPDVAAEWNKKFKRRKVILNSIVDVIEKVVGNSEEADPSNMEKIGAYLKRYPKTTQEFLDAMNQVQESIDLESIVGKVLTQLRETEEETSSEDLTPEQVAAVNDIFSISEGDENLDDNAKFEKLTAKIQKYASKGILTAALVATLVSMASCSGSKGMTNCNFIKAKMSGYRE